jgi:hypothetical protein
LLQRFGFGNNYVYAPDGTGISASRAATDFNFTLKPKVSVLIFFDTLADSAVLKQLRINHGNMRYQSTKASQIQYALDVLGPILPHHLLNLCSIATSSAVKSFHVTCTNQDSTFPFNHSKR